MEGEVEPRPSAAYQPPAGVAPLNIPPSAESSQHYARRLTRLRLSGGGDMHRTRNRPRPGSITEDAVFVGEPATPRGGPIRTRTLTLTLNAKHEPEPEPEPEPVS